MRRILKDIPVDTSPETDLPTPAASKKSLFWRYEQQQKQQATSSSNSLYSTWEKWCAEPQAKSAPHQLQEELLTIILPCYRLQQWNVCFFGKTSSFTFHVLSLRWTLWTDCHFVISGHAREPSKVYCLSHILLDQSIVRQMFHVYQQKAGDSGLDLIIILSRTMYRLLHLNCIEWWWYSTWAHFAR